MKRILPILFLLLPLTAVAQTNDVSLFLGGVQFDETTLAAFAPQDFTADLTFENGRSLTLGFNHFWRDRFSTEIALAGMSADPTVKVSDGPVDISVDIGSIKVSAITAAAQWHFRTGARVSPYVGGGVALIGGEIESEVEDEDGVEINESADLEGAATLLINGGLNIRIRERWIFAIDAKLIPYAPEIEEDDVPDQESIDEIDLNPFILSLGIRYRF